MTFNNFSCLRPSIIARYVYRCGYRHHSGRMATIAPHTHKRSWQPTGPAHTKHSIDPEPLPDLSQTSTVFKLPRNQCSTIDNSSNKKELIDKNSNAGQEEDLNKFTAVPARVPDRLRCVLAPTPIALGRWNHVIHEDIVEITAVPAPSKPNSTRHWFGIRLHVEPHWERIYQKE